MNIRWNLSGMEIERESFRVIESECDLHKWMPAPEWRVARRLIHTKMIRAGLSIERLKRLNPGYGPESLHCHISDQDVIERAKLEGHTRALCSAEKARPMLDGAIVLIGNAPLALARIARYALEEGVRPALVVGMPVGFVNVVESKELLAQCDVPQIVLEGRRGGSALAVTTLHAVMESA